VCARVGNQRSRGVVTTRDQTSRYPPIDLPRTSRKIGTYPTIRQCFCVPRICLQVAEGYGGSPSRAQVKEHQPGDLWRLKPKATSHRCHHH
jgi:hypothetical protein